MFVSLFIFRMQDYCSPCLNLKKNSTMSSKNLSQIYFLAAHIGRMVHNVTHINHLITKNIIKHVSAIPPNSTHLSPSDRFSMCRITVFDNPSKLATSSIFRRNPC